MRIGNADVDDEKDCYCYQEETPDSAKNVKRYFVHFLFPPLILKVKIALLPGGNGLLPKYICLTNCYFLCHSHEACPRML